MLSHINRCGTTLVGALLAITSLGSQSIAAETVTFKSGALQILQEVGAPEVISIGQKTNPSPVPVSIGGLGAVPFVASPDAKLATALEAKWTVDAHCQTQLGNLSVKHPNLGGWTTKVQPTVPGKKGFIPGSYFRVQSYNIETVKDVCLKIVSGKGYPGFSEFEIFVMQDQFNASGGFLVDIPSTASDRLYLTGACLNAVGISTLSVSNKPYQSQPITVACCSADLPGTGPAACQIL